MAVYDWENNRIVATSKIDKKNVLDIASSDSGKELLTVGTRHVKLFRINGTRIKGTRVSFPRKSKPEAILAAVAVKKKFFIGSKSGKIISV